MCTQNWDKYVILHKEQHTIMESLANHGYHGIKDGTKVYVFLQRIKSTELDAAVNIVWAQPEKKGKDFYATILFWSKCHEEVLQ